MSKLLRYLVLLLAVMIVIGYVMRVPLMQGIAHVLIHEDTATHCDVMVVLSGNAFDRGNEGARLFRAGYAPHIICPGGNMERLFLIAGDTVYESDMLKRNVMRLGIADTLVTAIHAGTSTLEEADTIRGYCMARGIHSIMVVTNLFHTRRARAVYQKVFAKTGITIHMRGAHDSGYDEEHWWTSEYGLIALNNEYMKTLYYWLK
jgi:uncharacterized SAM-binding protein YcdF (DUF218 family)